MKGNKAQKRFGDSALRGKAEGAGSPHVGEDPLVRRDD